MKTGYQQRFHRIPRPQNDAEFAILTRWLIGVELHLRALWVDGANTHAIYARYEVEEDFDSYLERFPGYPSDVNGALMEHAVGKLNCGGVARRAYGSVIEIGHRQHLRLFRWVKSRELGGRGGGASPPVRSQFLRLAERVTRAQREQLEPV